MNQRSLFETSFRCFQYLNSIHKCLPRTVKNVYNLTRLATSNCLFLPERSLHVSSVCLFKNKRRRAPEPVILKIKSLKEILELYDDVNLKYFFLKCLHDIKIKSY